MIRILPLLSLFLLIACESENLPPVAGFTCTPPEGNIRTLFDLDASRSDDPDGLQNLLQYRWDADGDGHWDGPFGPGKINSCWFSRPGTYRIRLEVMDTYGAVSSDSLDLFVDSLKHMTDPRDGRTYPVVRFAGYWWMAANLNYGLVLKPDQLMTDNRVVERYTYPGDDPDSLAGGLYTWDEAMGYKQQSRSEGVCPPGWFLPSDADWKTMLGAFRAAGMQKPKTYWIRRAVYIPDQQVVHDNYLTDGAVWRLLRSTGSSGFDVVPVGYRTPDGLFGDRDYYFPGQTATFWTSTTYGDYSIRVRLYMTEDHQGDIFRLADNRHFAFSVRCIKPVQE